jgi:two-component system, sensor histidine kinase
LKAAPGNRNLVEQMAATMGRETQQLVRLVDDLLEVSRISGGKLQLRTSIIDLRDVIQDAVAGATASAKRAGHTLTVDIPDEPLRVEGDATRLVQVVSNLLNNAVRYTPSPGRIEVRAARQADDAVLDVADSEGGAAAGLGIGLTLARKLIELHGGRIAVTSAGQQQGSTFEIRVPLARQIPAPQPAATAARH